MSRKVKLFLSAFGTICLLGAGNAANNAQAQEVGRYQLDSTENGYVRLDTRTGALSICTLDQEQLVCKMAAEDREAYENDIQDLGKRVGALENKIAALQQGKDSSGTELPSEDEFERSLGYMERFMRRFMDIAKGFDSQSDEPVPPQTPGKT